VGPGMDQGSTEQVDREREILTCLKVDQRRGQEFTRRGELTVTKLKQEVQG